MGGGGRTFEGGVLSKGTYFRRGRAFEGGVLAGHYGICIRPLPKKDKKKKREKEKKKE